MKWSLKELYESFESPEFLRDSKRSLTLIEEVNAYAEKEFQEVERAKEKLETYFHLPLSLYRK